MKDREAFQKLYHLTSAKLFGVLLRILPTRANAEDALQEVYIKIWLRSESYTRSSTSPMTWLISIARNHAIDQIRVDKSALKQPLDNTPEIDMHSDTDQPEQLAMDSAERDQIQLCLDTLEPQKSEAVRSVYLEGYSYQELADRFNIPLNTIRTWLRRSLIKLKECLER